MLESMPFVADLFETCGAGTGQEKKGSRGSCGALAFLSVARRR